MAFDGLTVAALTKELSDRLTGLRINKIAEPEADELMLTIKGNSETVKLLISANATLPLVYITNESKPSPLTAPNFCMLLRKHITNARILSVTQPGLERVIVFSLEHLDEMGDVRHKKLIVELMGKHSNIIFTDENNTIIDSVKHVSHNISSVREVLPGREWFIPETLNKKNPIEETREAFTHSIKEAHSPLNKALLGTYTGISTTAACEIAYRAGIDGDMSTSSLSDEDIIKLYNEFKNLISDSMNGHLYPQTVYEGALPFEYAVFKLTMFSDKEVKTFGSVSELIEAFYKEKSIVVRIRQKSTDLRKIVTTALERNVKKLDLQTKQLEDTKKKDKLRIYGELINTYGYNVPEKSTSFKAVNYYTNEEVTIPLDPTISVKDNATKYFDKYGKLKRTAESLTEIIKSVSEQVEHLKSILTSLDIAVYEEDLAEIKAELMEAGYIKYKNTGGKKQKITSKPFHFVSPDGFDVYVGKNNYQNDKLTFDFATGGDWWFHAKKMPGSHVIVKTEGREVPDSTFEYAAGLAAYYSAGRESSRVEIDYTLKKNVKKPAGAKPGFVVYYTNYSMVIDVPVMN